MYPTILQLSHNKREIVKEKQQYLNAEYQENHFNNMLLQTRGIFSYNHIWAVNCNKKLIVHILQLSKVERLNL